MFAGDREAAKALLVKALEFVPHAVDPRIRLVRMLLDEGDPEAGLKVALKGVELAPDATSLLVATGKAYMDGRQPAEAVTIFRQVAERLPRSEEANFLLGQAAIAAGDTDTAKGALDIVLSENNEHQAAMVLRAELALDERDLESAKNLVGRLDRIAPDNTMVVRFRGRLAALER